MSELTVYRGDDRTYTLTFSDLNGTIDISNWTVFFTVKNSDEDADGDALISKTYTSGEHTNPISGETAITITSTDTDMDSGTYWYDIQIKREDDKIRTVTKDLFNVEADISRRVS